MLGYVSAGREDAKAAFAKQQFDLLMDWIEKNGSVNERAAVAAALAMLLTKYRIAFRRKLPDGGNGDCFTQIHPKVLQAEGEKLLDEGRAYMESEDKANALFGMAQTLSAYYLLSHSWRRRRVRSKDPSTWAQTSVVIRARIWHRLSEFLRRYDLLVPS